MVIVSNIVLGGLADCLQLHCLPLTVFSLRDEREEK